MPRQLEGLKKGWFFVSHAQAQARSPDCSVTPRAIIWRTPAEHARDSALPWPQKHSAHDAIYGIGVQPIQGLLEGLVVTEFLACTSAPAIPLRRYGSLVSYFTHRPSPHREDCAFSFFEPSGSRWFWLSPHGAIKCVACASPADLSLVEAWVLARETGEGADGWRIPGEILSLLHVASSPQ